MPDNLRKEVQKRLKLLSMGKVSDVDSGPGTHVVSSCYHDYHNNCSEQQLSHTNFPYKAMTRLLLVQYPIYSYDVPYLLKSLPCPYLLYGIAVCSVYNNII